MNEPTYSQYWKSSQLNDKYSQAASQSIHQAFGIDGEWIQSEYKLYNERWRGERERGAMKVEWMTGIALESSMAASSSPLYENEILGKVLAE